MHRAIAVVQHPHTQRIAHDTSGVGLSYMVSSQDLRAGLEVRWLAATQLPAELLRELLRLQGCWQAEVGRIGHRLAV